MNNSIVIKTLLSLILIINFTLLSAQMEITPGNFNPYTPESLITDIFIDDGVEVLNVTYTGDPEAVGYFFNASGDIGIERGIVMTSGQANLANGPANCEDTNSCGTTGGAVGFDNTGLGDQDLLDIAPSANSINDAAIYEIDFIPLADTLRFSYVFGSEEYPEWVCSFNDAFGFFLSGPGINGPYSNNSENIALIPGTNFPVTIDNVNDDPLCVPDPATMQYYVSNNGNVSVEYDGYTKVFVATAVVIPCQQYKIKLAIGDANDHIYDSGVFLEAKSFGTGSLNVEAVTFSIDGTISEGCSDALLSFVLPNPTPNDYPINYTIGGTATNGVDYTTIPTNLTIPAGGDSIGILISAFEDNAIEAIENIEIIVQTDVCFFDTLNLKISDNQLIDPILNDTSICAGEIVSYDANIPIVIPPPISYTSTIEEQLFPNVDYQYSINVSGVPFTTLAPGVINSICFNASINFTTHLTAYLVSPGGQIVELTSGNGGFAGGAGYFGTCFTETASTDINYDPGGSNQAPPSAIPFTGNWQPEGVWSDLYGGPVNGEWKIIFYDVAAGWTTTIHDWSITFNNAYYLNYEWTPNVDISCNDCPNPDVYPSTSTTYTVVITDSYGCSVSETVDVTVIDQLPAPTLSCGTSTSNSITVNWQDVVGATSYQVNIDGTGWIPSSDPNSHTVNGLSLNQTVTVEVQAISQDCGVGLISSIDCTTTNCSLTANLDNVNDVSCFNGNDGEISIIANGTGTINFDLNNGNINNTGTFSNLIAGTYTIVVNDDLCTTTLTATINQPTSLSSSSNINNISCNGFNDGNIELTVSGGSYPYSYSWNNGLMDTDSIVDNISANTYIVTITDANLCTITHSATISEDTAISLSTSSSGATCDGIEDGSTTVNASGGSGTYTYLWNDPNNQTTSTASNLNTGTYTVTVTDNNGCSATTSATVSTPSAIITSTSSTPASCSGNSDGTATVTVNGGTSPYDYLWSNSETNPTASNLIDGWHYITVTDDNGCFVIDSVEVTTPNPIILTISGTDASCNNGNDGTANISASGGNNTFTYLWSNSETTSFINTLIANIYTVTVTDGNNCTATESIQINEPSALNIQITPTVVSCFGGNDGTASTSVTGGDGNYTYLWSDLTNQTTQTATNLEIGLYTVTVSDGQNCSSTASIEIVQNTNISASTSSTNATCNGIADGTASVSASGGTAPYTYLWNDINNQTTNTAINLDVGIYIVTITDNLNCTFTTTASVDAPNSITTSSTTTPASCSGSTDGTATINANGGTSPYTYLWSNNQTTQTATNLIDGWHYVSVTDNNGCMVVDSAEVTTPNPIILNITGTDISCFNGNDGTSQVIVSGGNQPYTYLWSNNNETSQSINGLTSGIYTVTVTDNNNCSSTTSIELLQATPVDVILSNTVVSCFGGNDGTTSVNTSGGTAPYDYLWSNNQTTSTASNLNIGFYTVTVTDDLGCTATGSIEVGQNSEITAFTTTTDATCNGTTDGTATVFANGGTPPFTYLWNDTNNQTTQTAIGLSTNTYIVTITDNLNCTTTASATVGTPNPIISSTTSTDITCFGITDGTGTVQASGGTGNLFYNWSNNQIGTFANNLSLGWHYVTITDQNNCFAIDSVYINEPSQISLNITSDDVLCSGGTDGSATVNVMGGTPPYTYFWSNNLTTQTINNIALGSYTVIVTDNNNCTASQSITIGVPNPIIISLSATHNLCFGDTNGTISSTISGGSGQLSIIWSNNETTNNISDLATGTYTITVSDEQGCTSTSSIDVEGPLFPVDILISDDMNICYSSYSGVASATGNGGTAPYSFNWSNNSTNNIITDLAPGIYTVTVTDNNGCSSTEQSEIIEAPEGTSTLEAQATSCYDGNDGIAYFTDINGNTNFDDYSIFWNTSPQQTGYQATGLSAGVNYQVTIIDNLGCTYENNITIPNNNPIILDTLNITSVSCNSGNNGSITVNSTNGTPPYNYIWSDFQTGSTANSLSAGFYTVTVTDSNGCTMSESYFVPQTSPLNLNLSGNDASCFDLTDGIINSFITGGTAPISYSWSNGSVENSITTGVGTYTLTVTDANGCSTSASYTINQPDEILADYISNDVTCYGDRNGDILVNISGGTYPYYYSLDSINVNTNNYFNGLYPGTYTVFIYDSNGCSTSINNITINEPDELMVNIIPDTSEININLGDSIELIIEYFNNIGDIEILWEGLNDYNLSCDTCINTWAYDFEHNQYQVSIVDENGCTAEDYIDITINRNRNVFVPSAFTPNNDEMNDHLMVHGTSGTKVLSFRVYDRWGELVFKAENYDINSTDPNVIWNGTFKGATLNPAVFVWYVEVEYLDGRKDAFSGNSTLIR